MGRSRGGTVPLTAKPAADHSLGSRFVLVGRCRLLSSKECMDGRCEQLRIHARRDLPRSGQAEAARGQRPPPRRDRGRARGVAQAVFRPAFGRVGHRRARRMAQHPRGRGCTEAGTRQDRDAWKDKAKDRPLRRGANHRRPRARCGVGRLPHADGSRHGGPHVRGGGAVASREARGGCAVGGSVAASERAAWMRSWGRRAFADRFDDRLG